MGIDDINKEAKEKPMAEWVVVLDGGAESQRQLDVCKELRHPAVKGAVRCDQPENRDVSACAAVGKEVGFPAFCHEPTNSCVYGFRGTREELDALPTNAAATATRE